MHSFRSDLGVDSEKVGTTNHTQLKFQEQHTCYAKDSCPAMPRIQVHVLFG